MSIRASAPPRPAARARVLLVEDEPSVRFGLRTFLDAQGIQTEEADTCAAALREYRKQVPDLVILDYSLPDGNALELLPALHKLALVPVIVLTAFGSIELAVRAVKDGAEQFLTKPVELPALLVVIERILENERNRKKQLASRSQSARERVDPFVGRSRVIQELADAAMMVAATDRPVLILGDTGSGKGVLARWLHAHGPRADEPFVDFNCAALARDLVETELFGHEKGAFTGAATGKPGLLEVAHRGTVFLDEIGDMSPDVQPKLLKVLEDRRFRRLGDVRDRQVDIRLVAATHQDLRELVRAKRFRGDLYYRVSTLPLHVPPLRSRREDIPELVAQLLDATTTELGKPPMSFADDAMHELCSYPWPGNIRELRNVIERAVLLARSAVLDRAHLRFDAGEATTERFDTRLTLREMEVRHIRSVLEEEGGHVERAAARLGVPRSSLYQKIKRHGLEGVKRSG